MPDAVELLDSSKSAESPVIFISHDTRDADLAEAFGKLLRSVSAGMLKPFRSSDRKGTEGIEFGDEWFKTLMTKLALASDVVCLLTERSLERPWILYEAGVAKGKLNTPVHGIALGVPLSSAASGPFYQFQNSDDSEESLTKLVLQLCRRVSNLEPDQDVVASQVRAFKSSAAEALKHLGSQKKADKQAAVNESSVAKVMEEMKLLVRELSMRMEDRLVREGEERNGPRRSLARRMHPMMIEEISLRSSGHPDDPVGLLVIASLLKDDFPWLYELGLEAYRAAKGKSTERATEALCSFRDAAEFASHPGFLEEMGISGKRDDRIMREIPRLIHRYIERRPRKTSKTSVSEINAKS